MSNCAGNMLPEQWFLELTSNKRCYDDVSCFILLCNNRMFDMKINVKLKSVSRMVRVTIVATETRKYVPSVVV